MQRRSARHAAQSSEAADVGEAPLPVARRSQRVAAEAAESAPVTPQRASKTSRTSGASATRSSQRSRESRLQPESSSSDEEEDAEARLPVRRVNAVPAHSSIDALLPLEKRAATYSSPRASTSRGLALLAQSEGGDADDVRAPPRTPLAPPPSSSPPHAAAPASDSEADARDELRNSTRFLLLRSFLLIVIFLVLFTLTQWYVLEPTFQPHRTAAYKQQQEAAMRSKIAANICPQGGDCSYTLKDEYKMK